MDIHHADDIHLMDAWILQNPDINHPYPDAAFFEVETVHPSASGVAKIYSITQFSSRAHYTTEYYPGNCGPVAYPVCVVRSHDPEVIRRIWNAMIERGWKRLPSGTAPECSLAITANRAKKHRERLTGADPVTQVGVEYSGRYADSTIGSDHRSTIFFPSNFSLTGIVLRHPITHMPMNGKHDHKYDWTQHTLSSWAQKQKNIVSKSYPRHLPPNNTQYALEA